MSAVSLLDETREIVVISLPGAVGLSWLIDGRVTSYVTSDRQPYTDGVQRMPELVSLRGVFAEDYGTIDAFISTLRSLKTYGIPLTVQRPGRAPLPSFQIERVTLEEDATQSVPFTIDFKQRRVARARRVTLATVTPPSATRGEPRSDIAPGQAEEVNEGERPVSMLKSGINSISGLLQ